MDALKLRMRAKDQLHPLLQELVTSSPRLRVNKEWEGGQVVCPLPSSGPQSTHLLMLIRRLITLNAMKASEEITEDQSR